MKQLKKFPNIPVATREEHRGSCHNSRRAPVLPPYPERKVHFPASSGKESRLFCCNSRGGGLNLNLERHPGVVPRFQKTLMSQSTPDTPDSPALTRRSSQGLTQNTMAGVTALCTLKECHRSICQLGKKPDTTITTREESGLACLHTR